MKKLNTAELSILKHCINGVNIWRYENERVVTCPMSVSGEIFAKVHEMAAFDVDLDLYADTGDQEAFEKVTMAVNIDNECHEINLMELGRKVKDMTISEINTLMQIVDERSLLMAIAINSPKNRAVMAQA